MTNPDNGWKNTSESDLPMNVPVILIADDDDSIRETVGDVLEFIGGHQVIRLTNGRDLVSESRLRSENILLIITDNAMPQMTGEEALTHIREINPTVPILMFTALDKTIEQRGELRDKGFTGFVPKPVEVSQLLEIAAQYASREP